MYVFKEIFIARETHEKLFYVTFSYMSLNPNRFAYLEPCRIFVTTKNIRCNTRTQKHGKMIDREKILLN